MEKHSATSASDSKSFHEYASELFNIQSFELICLRGHALIELALQQLLAQRLGVEGTKLADLNFARLAVLALAGMPAELVDVALHVNRIRNYVAHHLHAHELEQRLTTLFAERQAFHFRWPATEDEPAKRFFLVTALAAVATAIQTASDVLREFRESQRALKSKSLGYDEPIFFEEVGPGIVDQLGMEQWFKLIENRRAQS